MSRGSGARARKLRDAVDQVGSAAEPRVRRCDAPGCERCGEYKAPKSPDRLGEYFWFCLEHVREYNRGWNYCRDMSENDIEHTIRHATTWERPSWPFGTRRRQDAGMAGTRIRDDFEVLGFGSRAAGRKASGMPPEQVQALSVFGLDPPVTLDEVKARYKRLVKMTHPDRNGGDRAAEERLKSINEAYTTLRRFLD